MSTATMLSDRFLEFGGLAIVRRPRDEVTCPLVRWGIASPKRAPRPGLVTNRS